MGDLNDMLGLGWKAAILACCLSACSSSAGTDSPVNGTAQSAGSGGGTVGGGHEGPLETGPQINIGGSASTAGGPGSFGSGGVCNADSHEGERLPLDMYFLVDSSLSMNDKIEGGGTRWAAVSTALTGFLSDPTNAGSALGLGYFPFVPPPMTCQKGDPNCVCFGSACVPSSSGLPSCNVDDYAEPTVPLALPPSAAPLIADLEKHDLDDGTPTRPALEGALKYVTSWASMHPDRKTVIVLATDGEPTGCPSNTPDDVAKVAADALASPAAIQTFVIGVGSSLQSLDLIAQAGGTEHAYLVEDSNASTAFAQALGKIRGVAAPCEFSIPAPVSKGKGVDPSKVNVEYTAVGSMMPTLVARTSDGTATGCGPEGGWHYDNPAAPTTIELCPTTCASLGSGHVEVQFGCQTIVQPPR